MNLAPNGLPSHRRHDRGAGRRGFTVVEVVVALVILSAGLLGLAGGTALATRMAGRGARAGIAVTYARQRMESARANACASRVAGRDTLFRSGSVAAINAWKFFDRGNSTYLLQLTTTYTLSAGTQRSFSSEEAFSCLP
jgi:prepilin-type N-terminal cleavage/methylation domain-containing protein